jgi:hypothetical protein
MKWSGVFALLYEVALRVKGEAEINIGGEGSSRRRMSR